jgi:hypothetical protein
MTSYSSLPRPSRGGPPLYSTTTFGLRRRCRATASRFSTGSSRSRFTLCPSPTPCWGPARWHWWPVWGLPGRCRRRWCPRRGTAFVGGPGRSMRLEWATVFTAAPCSTLARRTVSTSARRMVAVPPVEATRNGRGSPATGSSWGPWVVAAKGGRSAPGRASRLGRAGCDHGSSAWWCGITPAPPAGRGSRGRSVLRSGGRPAARPVRACRSVRSLRRPACRGRRRRLRRSGGPRTRRRSA